MNQYEAMFLFDPTFAANFGDVENEIRRILDRAEAEIIVLKKWEERRLAYEINKQKRGCYVLVYFRSKTDRIVGIERDCKLSEAILRVLILDAGDLTEQRMKSVSVPAPESRGDDDRPPRRSSPPASESRTRPGESPAATATLDVADEKATSPDSPADPGKPEAKTDN